MSIEVPIRINDIDAKGWVRIDLHYGETCWDVRAYVEGADGERLFGFLGQQVEVRFVVGGVSYSGTDFVRGAEVSEHGLWIVRIEGKVALKVDKGAAS